MTSLIGKSPPAVATAIAVLGSNDVLLYQHAFLTLQKEYVARGSNMSRAVANVDSFGLY